MSFTDLSITGFGWDAAPVLPLPATREASSRAIDPKLPTTAQPKKPVRRTVEPAWSEEAAQAQVNATLARVSRACPADYELVDDMDCWNALEEAVIKARTKKRRAALATALEQFERLALGMFERHRERQELMLEQLELEFDSLPMPKYN